MPTVVLIGTLDTKGEEYDYLRARLREQGIEPEREPYRVREGGSRICFVRDPDSYRIELIDSSGK
jgi:lactoylglutathione lyase